MKKSKLIGFSLIFTLSTTTLFGTVALAEIRGPAQLNCEISAGSQTAKSQTKIEYVEYYTIYGQLFRGYEFNTIQSGEVANPKLHLRFRNGQASLEDEDLVDFGFEPGKFDSATLGEFLRGISRQLPKYGEIANVYCLLTPNPY